MNVRGRFRFTSYFFINKKDNYYNAVIIFYKCLVPESNQRHEDFQSSALPTELTRHNIFCDSITRVAGIGFEPMTSGL